jgi:hypothetical protein
MTAIFNGTNSGASALSDQPAAIKELLEHQFASGKYFDGASAQGWQQSVSKMGVSPGSAYPGVQKDLTQFLDPAALQLISGIVTQIVSAFSGQKGADSTQAKFVQGLIFQLLGTVVTQVVNAVQQKGGSPAVASKGEMKREYFLPSGGYEVFPTWSFWGETNVRLDNTGTVPTVALVNDLRFHLNPGEGTTVPGKWAAFPVRVTNSSELPGSQLRVVVT